MYDFYVLLSLMNWVPDKDVPNNEYDILNNSLEV